MKYKKRLTWSPGSIVLPKGEPITGKSLIQHIVSARLKIKKNTVIFISGDNGDGKSYTALRIAEIVDGENFDPETQIVYNPSQYSKVMHSLLHSRKHVLIMDEADKLISAHSWYNFVQQAIAAINSTYRQIHRLVLIVVAPSLRRIDLDNRELINYYIVSKRFSSGIAHLRIYRIEPDRFTIQNPQLQMRKLKVFAAPDGKKYHAYFIDDIRVQMPDKRITEKYEKFSYEFKGKLIEKKMQLLEEEVSKEIEKYSSSDKIDMLTTTYATNDDMLRTIYRKGKLNKQVLKTLHGITGKDLKRFKTLLEEKLVSLGVISNDVLNRKKVVMKNG